MENSNTPKEFPTCSFCGGEVRGGFSSGKDNPVYVCEKCLVQGAEKVIGDLREQGLSPVQVFSIFQDIKYDGVDFFDEEEEKMATQSGLKPIDIKEKLDEYIIGQEQAKRILSVASYNHYKRINANIANSDVEIEKSNILLLGPTGTGKTLLVKTLAKIVDVPVAIADATSLTENGYVGDDVESIVEKLYLASDRNIKRAEKGIIYIDEIDKIAADFESSRKDVGGAGVQQALLKIIEGHKIHFVPSSEKKNPMASSIEIDTTNILFIVGGAFANIDYDNITHDSIKQYGIIPELLGRLPIITKTEELTIEHMVRILKEPKNSLLRQYQEMFKMENIDLVFTEKAIKEIAKKGLESKTGARGLRGIIEHIMLDLAFDAPSVENLSKAVVDFDNGKIVRRFVKMKKEGVA